MQDRPPALLQWGSTRRVRVPWSPCPQADTQADNGACLSSGGRSLTGAPVDVFVKPWRLARHNATRYDCVRKAGEQMARQESGAFASFASISDGIVVVAFGLLSLGLLGVVTLGALSWASLNPQIRAAEQREAADAESQIAARKQQYADLGLEWNEELEQIGDQPSWVLKGSRAFAIMAVGWALYLVVILCYLFGIYAHARAAARASQRISWELDRLRTRFNEIGAPLMDARDDIRNAAVLLGSIDARLSERDAR